MNRSKIAQNVFDFFRFDIASKWLDAYVVKNHELEMVISGRHLMKKMVLTCTRAIVHFPHDRNGQILYL